MAHDFNLPVLASQSWGPGEIFLLFLGLSKETRSPDDYTEVKHLQRMKFFMYF